MQIKVAPIIESFANVKVMIVGDVMVDSYLWGNVDRISPEAPVPVVACNKRENRLGGAANVALNIAGLDAVPVLCSLIGDDEKGKVFLELMQEQNLPLEGILVDKSRITTSKTRILSNHQQLLRVDQEQTDFASAEIENQFISLVKQQIEQNDIKSLIFQDYDKGVITKKVIEEVTAIANQKGIPVLVDPKKRNFLNFQHSTVFKPNFKEFTEGLNITLTKSDYSKIFAVAKEFLADNNIQELFLTLSEKGVFICDKDSYIQIPTQVRDISDVSGAGDTVISIAGLCKATGQSMQVMAAIANLAGGLVCEKVGVVPVSKQDLCLKELILS